MIDRPGDREAAVGPRDWRVCAGQNKQSVPARVLVAVHARSGTLSDTLSKRSERRVSLQQNATHGQVELKLVELMCSKPLLVSGL